MTPTVVGNGTPLSDNTGSVTLSSASPTFIDGEGKTDSYEEHTFTVPANADYLNGNITWTADTANVSVYETLFNPLGQVAAYSLLGANGSGFGHVEVRQPMAGTWTAVIFTIDNAAAYGGDVQFSYATQQFQNAGAVFPSSRTLRPGQSANFRVQVPAGRPETTASGCTSGRVEHRREHRHHRALAGADLQARRHVRREPHRRRRHQSLRPDHDLPVLHAVGPAVAEPGPPAGGSQLRPDGLAGHPNGQPLDVQSTAQFDARTTSWASVRRCRSKWVTRRAGSGWRCSRSPGRSTARI